MVRDKNNHSKLQILIDGIGSDLLTKVEFVSGDLNDRHSIEAAVQGCDFIVHTASPVNHRPKNRRDVIEPAVNGTTYVMEAAQKLKVKRVVYTSSPGAMLFTKDFPRP